VVVEQAESPRAGLREGDSRPDTLLHAHRVAELLAPLIAEFLQRSLHHDQSKLEPPELECFDEFNGRLAAITYMSPEYRACLEEMAGVLEHHYAVNRHHPQHFADGVNGMTLVDLLEMLADWKAASERHEDGDLRRSLEQSRHRFGLSPQLLRILENTAREYGWLSPRLVTIAAGDR
jgi:hypothetical protein